MVESDFFHIPAYTPALARLSQLIGAGRFGQTDAIAFKLSLTPEAPAKDDDATEAETQAEADDEAPPPRWKIELSLDGQTVLAWVDEAMLVEWLEPVLPVPDLSCLAVDLYPAALTYVLTPWFDWCSQHKLTPPLVKALSGPVSTPRAQTAALTLALVDPEQGRWLNLSLEHFPMSWLAEFAHTLPTLAEPAERPLLLSANAGVARLDLSALRSLAVGDVVMANWQAPIEAGGVLITFKQMWIQLEQLDDNQFRVENIMYQADDETNLPSDIPLSAPESTIASLPITLTFEIGRMSVPLSALSQLQLGDVLEADFKATPEISIRAQGQIIASATLVQIGERIGAKITHMIQSEMTHDTVE